MRDESELRERLTRVRSLALVAGVAGVVLCAIGAFVAPRYFFPAYLVAYWFWLSVSLGCLGLALLHHLTGGGWGIGIRRILEAGYSTLPLMAVLFLPIVFGMQSLYSWTRPDEIDAIVAKKQWWLNVPGFQLRALVYFAVWIGFGFFASWLSSGTRGEDEPRRQRRLALLSGPGLIFWGLTITFAAIDWAMSLEPHWFSSMFGVIFIGGCGVAGLSATIIILMLVWPFRPWAGVVTVPRVMDLGNLLLAFVMFWTYVSFSQYLIIWSGNLPEETTWYLKRGWHGWEFVVYGLIVLHFFVPFLLLLIRQTKRHPERLMAVAGLLLVMRMVDLYWTIMPTFSPGGLWLNWMILVTPVAIGGLWLAMFAWRLPARAALPVIELPPDETGENEHELAQHATA